MHITLALLYFSEELREDRIVILTNLAIRNNVIIKYIRIA